MSQEKVDLVKAKEILGTDKVFLNGKNKFNVLDNKTYYSSGVTLVIPQNWTRDKRRNVENPIEYKTIKELTDGMNIDFDGDAEVLLGKYHLSQKGRPVFEITKPIDAKDVLIKVDWGGSFNYTRGQSREYAEETGAKFFTIKRSNGGRLGRDYWVLPVDLVKDNESRDVSGILKELQKKEDVRVAEIDAYLEQEDKEINESISNRENILQKANPIVKQIKEIQPKFYFIPEKTKVYCGEKYSYYQESLITSLNER